MGSAFPYLIIITAVVCAAQLISSYSFNNCIELTHGQSFQCIERKRQTLAAIVKDLPPSATNVNITDCHLKVIPHNSFAHLSQLQNLRLDNNQLSFIDRYAFQDLHQLKCLNLSFNNISSLNSDVFKELSNLTILSLAQNKLKQFPKGIFSDVTNLKTLILKENLLTDFSGIVNSILHLTSLALLDLSFNNLTSLSHGSLTLPETLKKLYLVGNNLHELACDKYFLGSINELDLSYNVNLSETAFHGVDLRSIELMRLQFTKVNIFKFMNISEVQAAHIDYSGTGLSNAMMIQKLCGTIQQQNTTWLQRLRLSNNSIQHLESNTICGSPIIIVELDLSFNVFKKTDCFEFLNEQTHITNVIFEHNRLISLPSCNTTNAPFLTNMTELSFMYNHIFSVMDYAFYNTPNLRTLKLNANRISYLDQKALKGLKNLETLHLDNNVITALYRRTFEDLINLNTLNLRNNRIAVIFHDTFGNLGNLTTLDLGGNRISQIKPNGLNGLRMLSKFYLDGNNLKNIESSLCSVFQDTLKVLDLTGNRITFLYQDRSSPFVNFTKLRDLKLNQQKPHGLIVLPYTLFRGLYSLEALYLTDNNLNFLHPDTFNDLTGLQFLTLDNCCVGVTDLQPGVFKNLQNLTKLTAENIAIQNFSKEVFGNLTQLRKLQLNHNAMESLSVDALENLPNLQYIDIRNTPLSCTCINSLLQSFLVESPSLQVVYLYQLACPHDSTRQFYNFDINVCYIDLGKYLFSTTVIIIVLFMVTPLLYVRLYWKMKYSYYVFSAWFSEQWSRFREEQETFKYDAFISYNSSDEKWVMEQLLSNLEGNGSSFKLCLHHRDFELGRNIVDNIVLAVYSSRKTVCVVSKSFLKSEWCSLEVQLATYRLFDEHRDVLLLVFLEPISESQLSSYHRMRKIMLKKTYLQWPGSDCNDPEHAQELFWLQLRRAIKKDGRQEREEPGLGAHSATPQSEEIERLNYTLD